MNYRDLQRKATSLGIKSVGVSKEDLEEAIKRVEDGDSVDDKLGIENKQADEVGDNADAVIYHGKHKVRAYTLESHGDDYVELAKQYISHPDREDYRIEFETVVTRLSCPHCGKKFRYN